MKFKPEDFFVHPGFQLTPQNSADIANQKLKEWLDQALVVYGVKDDETGWVFGRRAKHDTHKATVICMEEIPKQECTHEPIRKSEFGTIFDDWACKHCGVELIAEWKEKK